MIIENLKAQLKIDEGLSLKTYRCSAGYLTIGYGRNLDTCGIRDDEAELMLNNDIESAINDIKKLIPTFNQLTSDRQQVMINMIFNLGYHKLSGFKNMLAAIESNDYNKAADEMLDSKWARQVKGRATELVRMMKKG